MVVKEGNEKHVFMMISITKDRYLQMILTTNGIYLWFIFLVWLTFGSCQNAPIPKLSSHNFTILNTVYRAKISLADDTFTDVEDGNFRQLDVKFTNLNGTAVPQNNWIQYNGEYALLLFTSRQAIDNAPVDGYHYRLTAIDDDKNEGSLIYNFKFDSTKRKLPVYAMKLVVKSSLSAVRLSNDAQILFYLQEQKLAPYSEQYQQGIGGVDNIVTEELTITRKSNGETDIDLLYSSSRFLTQQCNIQDIINMRSKTLGSFADGYQNNLKTEFDYVSQSEQFNGPCNYLSEDKPVTGSSVFNTVSIKYGVYFTILVPKDVFKAPSTGSTMEITIKLRTQNGTALTPSSWININTNFQLEGYIPYTVAQSSSSFEFQLVGQTPILEEISQPLQINVEAFSSITPNYIVEFISYQITQINYSTFMKSFLVTMSKFLAVDQSQILIYSYRGEQQNISLRWTLSKFSVSGFTDIESLGAVSSLLLSSSGQPSTQLTEELSKIGFQLDELDIQLGPQMTKPIQLKSIGVSLVWGTFLEYVIPTDAFVDARDGIHLNFSILPINDLPFSSNNWLFIEPGTRVIRGVPVADQISTNVQYRFPMRVTNSLGNYIDVIFYLLSSSNLPEFSYSFRIILTYGPNEHSISRILYSFMSKLVVDYFAESNYDQTIVTSVLTFPKSRTVHIRYFNMSFKISPCDTKAIVSANMKLFSGKDPNPALIAIVSPEYNITDIVTDTLGSCNINNPPHVRDPSKLTSEVGPHSIRWGTVFIKQLSETLFNDEEDGGTRNLKITLKPLGSNLPLPLNSWIYYNETTFTVYAVPDQHTFNRLGPKNELKYILRAEDIGGKSVAVEYIVLPTGTSTNLYNVTMSINLFGIARVSYAQQLIVIVKRLEIIFGSTFRNKICVKSYQAAAAGNTNDGSSILIWTHCDLPSDKCNFQIINEIRSKLYTPNSNKINSNLNVKFVAFQVVGVIDLGMGACGLNPPEIKSHIPEQQITFCGLHTYQIPENAFIDQEDGNTRNLQLSLKKEGKSSLESWIEFDQNLQTISMLLTSTMDTLVLERTQVLILTAKDASNLERSQTITVNIEGKAESIDYKYILRFQPNINFTQSGKNTFIEIARKVSNYFQDDGKGFEAIQSAVSTRGIHVYEFGNCTIKYSPCEAVEMQKYKNKLKEASFISIFPPDFIVDSSSETLSGPCANDSPPSIDQLWSPIIVEVTKTYVLQIPQNAFKDKEQGNTRHLELELTDFTSKPLDKTFWVQFDAGSQTVTIIATKDIAIRLQPPATFKLLLTAFDTQRQSVTMTVEIKIIYPENPASHYVSMSLTVISTPLQTSSFTQIYSTLRTDIIKYFRDDVNLGLLFFHTATNTFNSSFRLIWTNTSISRVECENKKIDYMTSQLFSTGDTINPSLVSSLRSFNVLDVKLYYDGICKDQLVPPTVDNPPVPLKATFCSYIMYTIPENTFTDKIDGKTRQLTLDLKYPNGTAVGNSNFYITFNSTNQTLMIIPVIKYFTNLSYPINFDLIATAKRGLSVSTRLPVTVEGASPEYSFYFRVTAEWKDTAVVLPPLTYMLKEFIDKTSNYLGYTNHDVSLIDATKPSAFSSLFTVRVAICKLQYTPCDVEKINSITQAITGTNGNGINNFYQTFLQPKIMILTVNTYLVGPCNEGNKPPVVSRKIPDVALHACSTFEYKLDPNTFVDAEDGNDLTYVILFINGKPINTDTTWIHTTTDKNIIAIVNNNVVAESKQYIVTVRAYDSKELFVDTTWNINIVGNKRMIFYQFTMDLTPKIQQSSDKLAESFLVTKMVDLHFGDQNITNFISSSFQPSGKFRYTWSSCSLPNFCDPNAAEQYYTQVKSAAFENTLKTFYTINSIEMVTADSCKSTLNPPNPSRTIWNVQVDSCGGRTIIIPSDMFTDTEDGDTRNLNLEFERSAGRDRSLPNWITFDTTSQTINAFPTYEEARTFQLLPMAFTLKATDKSGLSSSIAVTLSVSVPVEAKYKYTFQYRTDSATMHKVQEMLLFSRKLASYLQSATQHISIYNYQYLNGAANTTRQITYGNCSVTYNPCNLAALTDIRDLFIDGNNFPISSFQREMLPLQIQFGKTDRQPPCIDTYNPPRVVNELPNITISYCQGYYEFQIPENTFYDNQDGGTRNLQITLKTQQRTEITSSSWIRFDSLTQTLYLFPLVYTSQSEITVKSNYVYLLTATDSSKLITDTPVNLKFQGSSSILTECQIVVEFSTIKTRENLIERLIFLNKKLREFFYLQPTENIAMVRYVESTQSVFRFQLYWSYCAFSYSQSGTERFDYYQFITRILMRLFKPDRKTIEQSFYTAFGTEYSVRGVRTVFTGYCQDLPPIIPQNTLPITLDISSCGYSQITIQATQFYDFEQGNSANLELSLHNSSGIEVASENWVNIDKQTRSIIAICNDMVRNSFLKVFTFVLRATDRKGQSANATVTITKTPSTELAIAPFDITFEMEYNEALNRPFVYQIRYLLQRIGSYYGLSATSEIYVKSYEVTPGFPEYRRIVWTACTSTNCSTKGILSKTKELCDNRGVLNSTFKTLFDIDFDVKKVYYMSIRCGTDLEPPYVVTNLLVPLKPAYCSIFTYTLPSNLFFDNVNGDIGKLKISLLTNDKSSLSTASMVQFNSAINQIYSVNVQSSTQDNSMYTLVATNSVKLSQSTNISINFQNTPYIADCPVDMSFEYKYLTSYSKDIDILIKALNVIKDFYKDDRIYIKVIKFKRAANSIFHLTWTNCTFQFSTSQQALEGLEESDRRKLTTIYSKVANENTNTATAEFKKAFDQYFQLNNIQVSYTCIERPPIPNNNNEMIEYARYCRLFERVLPNNLFTDKKDGDIRTMSLHLAYPNGSPVSKYEWLQLNTADKSSQYLYGTVTSDVEANADDRVYKYLIVCTDSSGRKATKALSVTIVSAVSHSFTNEFIVGFQSTFNDDIPTAFVLASLINKLTSFVSALEPSKQVYVKTFHRNSYLRFSYCQLPCTQSLFDSIYTDFQESRYKTTPSLKLKLALRDEFEANYLYINSYRCLPSSNIVIITRQCPPITVPTCGYFIRSVSQECFADSAGTQSSRDFLLTMQTTSGVKISTTSWIQFDVPTQSVYGITIWDRVSQSQTFQLTAQQPVSGLTATNSLQINVNDYSPTKTVSNEICFITLEFKDTKQLPGTDILVIKELITLITNYISTSRTDILVKSFTRNNGVASITYTYCTWVRQLQNTGPTPTFLTDIFTLLESYFRITELKVVGITNSFDQYIKQSGVFEFVRVITSEKCSTPPKPPPIPNKEITINVQSPCGIFFHLVPEDTFTDQKFGNTRQLKLEIVTEDTQQSISWISVNENQEIYGLIDQNVINTKPASGYRFLLKATNGDGQSSTTRTYVNIKTIQFIPEKTVKIQMLIPGASSDLRFKVSLIQQVQSFPDFRSLTQGFTISQFAPSGLIEIQYCKDCDAQFFLHAGRVSGNTNSLKAWLKNRFNLFFVVIVTTDAEEFSKDCSPASLGNPQKREISFCSSNDTWYLSADYTELIEEYDVSLVTPDNVELPLSSWINLLRNPYRIIGYPTKTIWRNQPLEGYRYKVVLQKNGQTVGVPQIFSFLIVGDPNGGEQKYTMEIQSTDTLANRKSNVYYITKTWEKIYALKSQSGIQHVSFTALDINAPFTFEISWLNCTKNVVCKVGEIGEPFITKQPVMEQEVNELKIVQVNASCNDNPPIPEKIYRITIPVCGYFKYRLEDAIVFYGNLQNLNVELKNPDGSAIARDSWIVLDDLHKEIQALPTQLVIDSAGNNGLPYQLLITDNTGRGSTSTLLVTFDSENRDVFYTFTVQIRSLLDPITTSYLQIQKSALTSIVTYVGDSISNYQVMSFTKTPTILSDESYTMRIKNCSVSQFICPKEEQVLKVTSDGIKENNAMDFKRKVEQSSGGNIIVNNIVFKLSTQRDRPPDFRKYIPDISVTYCSSAVYNIPDDIFEDREQGQLQYQLYDSNDNVVPRDAWVNINDTVIYVTPFIDIPSGTYYYKLRGVDKCGQYAQTTVIIKLSGRQTQSPYALSMLFDRTDVNNLAYFIWEVRQKIIKCSNKNSVSTGTSLGIKVDSANIRSELFQYRGTRMEYRWSDCALSLTECKQDEIDKATAYIFSSPNVVSNTFQDCLEPIQLLRVDETVTKDCSSPGEKPGVAKHPKFVTDFCRKVQFTLDPDTFVDGNGNPITSSLTLKLFKENFDPLPRTEWIQYDSVRKIIYGYPRTGEDPSNIVTKYNYKLKATNSNGLSSSTNLEIVLREKPIVNFVMSFQGQSRQINNRAADIDEEIELIQRLKSLYQENHLNDVAFIRTGENNIQFKWSFCNYNEMCDCNKIQTYKGKTTPFAVQQALGNNIAVESVNFEKKLQCGAKPIKINPITNKQLIEIGQCYKFNVPKDSFYDSDGVKFEIRTRNSNQFPDDHWLQIDDSGQFFCGILPFRTFLTQFRSISETKYPYQLVTKDLCDNELVTDTSMTINGSTYQQLNYLITVLVNRERDEFLGNCTDIELFLTKIAEYSNINKTDIVVFDIDAYNSTFTNWTRVSWGYKELRGSNCSNGTLYYYKSIFFVNYTTVNASFLNFMKPEYKVKSVTNRTLGECASPPVDLQFTDPEDDFPWWIIWILICIGVLALLFWCCWIWFPRCCPTLCDAGGLCGKCCGNYCWKCCAQPGKYSSFIDANDATFIEPGMVPKTSYLTDGENPVILNEEIIPDLVDFPESKAAPLTEDEIILPTDLSATNPESGLALPQKQDPSVLPTAAPSALPTAVPSALPTAASSALPTSILSSQIKTESYSDKRTGERRNLPIPVIETKLTLSNEQQTNTENIRTETYKDDRPTLTTILPTRRNERSFQLVEKVDSNDGDFFVERYKDRRPSSVVYVDDVEVNNNEFVEHRLVKPIVRDTSGFKSKQLFTVANEKIVNNPVILTTRSTSQKHDTSRRDEILVKKVRRRKSRSVSPRRITTTTTTTRAPTISLRVENEKDKSRKGKKKRATLVYKEPRHQKVVAISPTRRKTKIKYVLDDESVLADSRRDYKHLLETRERGRSTRTMGSLTSSSANDDAIYEESFFNPKNKRILALDYPGSDEVFVKTTRSKRRHKSHSPSRARGMNTRADDFELAYNGGYTEQKSSRRFQSYHNDSFV